MYEPCGSSAHPRISYCDSRGGAWKHILSTLPREFLCNWKWRTTCEVQLAHSTYEKTEAWRETGEQPRDGGAKTRPDPQNPRAGCLHPSTAYYLFNSDMLSAVCRALSGTKTISDEMPALNKHTTWVGEKVSARKGEQGRGCMGRDGESHGASQRLCETVCREGALQDELCRMSRICQTK